MPTRPTAPPADWLQAAVIARAAALGLTPTELARQSGVSQPHVRAFLLRQSSMGSHKLCKVLNVLGLTLTEARP